MPEEKPSHVQILVPTHLVEKWSKGEGVPDNLAGHRIQDECKRALAPYVNKYELWTELLSNYRQHDGNNLGLVENGKVVSMYEIQTRSEEDARVMSHAPEMMDVLVGLVSGDGRGFHHKARVRKVLEKVLPADVFAEVFDV